MGEPRHTGNVRRIDFAKAAAKPARLRADEPAARQQEPGRADRDRLKVVSLPEPHGARRHHRHRAPHDTRMLVIVVLAALLGAAIAAIVLDSAF